MSKVQIKLDDAGIRQMMNSEECTKLCEEVAEERKGKLQGNYTISTVHKASRVTVNIKTADSDTFYRQRSSSSPIYNELVKAVKG